MIKSAFIKLFVIITLSVVCNQAQAYYKVVAKDGSGDFLTVQAAIDAAPTTGSALNPDTIYIKNGRYREKITVPSNKPFIQLIGESVANVILTYDDYAGKMITCGTTVGTQNSASFTVNATDFTAVNITFENNHVNGTPDGNGQQAVAILVNSDRSAFKNCRFIGFQDTMYLKGSGTPRHYFKNCYIDGFTDYMFGSSIAVFDSCVLYNKNKAGVSNSYMVAPNTTTGQAYGFVFRNARIGGNDGGTTYYLGRPWQNNPKAVYIGTTIINYANILPAGWSTSSAGSATFADSYFAEHKTKRSTGAPADVSQRTAGSAQMTDADTVGYNPLNMFSGWDPCSVRADFCTNAAMPIAVSNFRGVKGTVSSQFDWNISWPMIGIQYNLMRSTDNVSFGSVYSVTSLTDTAVNFQYVDPVIPPSGSNYYYYVSASKSGFATHNTDTARILSISVLNVNASDALYLCGFSQALGSPSASQTYSISGSNLTSNVTITPPVNYEVSSNNINWFTNASPLTVTHTGGVVSTTTIYIRLNALAAGTYTGTIINSSAGATTSTVQVSGSTVAPPTSFLLQAWGLTQNNNDSVAVRSAGVPASSPTLKNLSLSDGSAASANIPGYSGQNGQALGANAAGNNWSAVGGTLKRDYYEQFTITANSGYSVRVDSITFSSAFYLTTSNIKMGVVYSKNGFTAPADSIEFSNGVGPSGALTTAVSGTFSRSFVINRQDGGPTDYYTLALNNATGVTLSAGQTLTIRLYWACGSTGTPRFAFIKNVIAKGVASPVVLPVQLISFNAVKQEQSVKLIWNATNEFNIYSFRIERSEDGHAFSGIGTVIAANSFNYQFIDNNPLKGISYYRLRLTDMDGSFNYSKTVALNFNSRNLSISPNPVTNYILIQYPATTGSSSLKIISADGRVVYEQWIKPESVQTRCNVAAMPRGVYRVIMGDGTQDQTITFIKQ